MVAFLGFQLLKPALVIMPQLIAQLIQLLVQLNQLIFQYLVGTLQVGYYHATTTRVKQECQNIMYFKGGW